MKKNEKIEFFKTTLFPKYKEDLENAGYCLDSQEKLEEFYNKHIHTGRTKRR